MEFYGQPVKGSPFVSNAYNTGKLRVTNMPQYCLPGNPVTFDSKCAWSGRGWGQEGGGTGRGEGLGWGGGRVGGRERLRRVGLGKEVNEKGQRWGSGWGVEG